MNFLGDLPEGRSRRERGRWHQDGGGRGLGGGLVVELLGELLDGGRAVELLGKLLDGRRALQLLDELLEGGRRAGGSARVPSRRGNRG